VGQPLRIDFISDIACPWCVIGLRGLQQALETIGDEVKAEIHLHPFELNPQMAPEGENTAEHVAKKYGSTRERSDAIRDVIKARGAELGFTFNYGPESRIWNTFDAHRLLHWAALEGKQVELKLALFKLTFTDHKPSNDPDALVAAAASVGLDAAKAREVLSSGAYTNEVRAEEQLWQSRGINAVPAIIFNQRWMVQGGQPPQVFEQAIRDIVSGRAKEA
jgi:predicted DsbA family dithiol-disulfide isomerase